MNYKKVASLVINDFFKNKKNRYGVTKDNVYGICDNEGARLIFVPDGYFPFDISKLSMNQLDLKKLIPDESDYIDARITKEQRVEKVGTVVKIESIGEDFYVWVNIKLLDVFEPDCSFKVFNGEKSKKSLVMVYENDSLVGLICPVYLKEEK